MEDFDRPLSLYDNLSELVAQQKQLQPHLKRKPPTPNPAMSIADNFEFNNIRFQFDDLHPSPTSPLLISAPPPKPRRAVMTPPRFSLDQRLNSLRPVLYPSNDDVPDTKYNGNNHKPDNIVTQSFVVNENNVKKQPSEPQTTKNNYDNRLHNDITNAISNLKPVHSEAKSSFFGLNGTHNKNNNDLASDLSRSNNDDDNKPLVDRKSAVQIQQPPPVVMRRLRDTLTPPAKKPSPRFSRDSLESRETEFNDSNRNSKAHSFISSTSTDRMVTPNTTLLSLLTVDTPKKAVTNNNNKSNDKLYADSPSPRNTRFLLPEGGDMAPRKEGDGMDGPNSMGDKRLSQLDPNQQPPVYMSTTVPQNIKGINIMGRHKPTRTSLRHSRMIVINKNFQSQHKNSLNIKCAILARIFLILQIIIGVALVTMGLYLLVWAPHTRIKDNPYWSGIMLVLSGILGLYLLSYKRTPLNRLKENFFMFVKINAAIILCCTIFFTMLAFIYASIHYHSLFNDDKECVPENVFTSGSSCICVFHNSHLRFTESDGERNATNLLAKTNGATLKPATPVNKDGSGVEVHYRDMSCNEVLGVWIYILLASTILNLLGLIFSVAYMLQFALGCRKPPQPKYLSVRQSTV